MTTPAEWYETHRELLDRAIAAAGARDYWAAYPESPSKSVYGEDAAPAGEQAFRALLGNDFPLELPGVTGTVGPSGRRTASIWVSVIPAPTRPR